MGFFRTACRTKQFGGGLRHGASACGERVRPIRFDQGIGAIDRETGLPQAVDRRAGAAPRRAHPDHRLPDHDLPRRLRAGDRPDAAKARRDEARPLPPLTDLLAERLDRLMASVRQDRAANIERLQSLLPDLIPSWAIAGGRHVIITGADHRVLARDPGRGRRRERPRARRHQHRAIAGRARPAGRRSAT